MHNPPKTQKLRDLTMSPTMHTSVKMPQLQPSRGSLPGNMQPHTSISMYSHGNYTQNIVLTHFINIEIFYGATTILFTTKDFLYFIQHYQHLNACINICFFLTKFENDKSKSH